METKRFENIGETLYSAALPNGLRLRVIPKSGYSTSFAAFATNYGGAYRRFRAGGDFIDTPAGVAHFLEHKMFDMPDGDGALSLLSANGADPNAFTSSGMTCYYFESTRSFYENLEMLLKFVSTPYFTAESVEKEQGIIGQEIVMTEDSPDFAVYMNLLKLLYASHPIRDAVAGTVESIAEITPEVLYSCHKVFYNPSNMTLCVAGDVDAEKILETAAAILPADPGPVPQADFGPAESGVPLEKIQPGGDGDIGSPVPSSAPRSLPPKTARLCCARSSRGSWPCACSAGRPRNFLTTFTPPGFSPGTLITRRTIPPARPPSWQGARAPTRTRSWRLFPQQRRMSPKTG
jgi:hypothetical protein